MKSFRATYKYNTARTIEFQSSLKQTVQLDKDIFENALHKTHEVIDLILKDIPVDIFGILGMRNLSAFIGELFVRSFESVSSSKFISNPHQDGYPDLLLMDSNGKDILTQIKSLNKLQDKSPFSPFANGGIEVKATVGSVPTPKECAKKKLSKPGMGDTRIDVLKGYDWKAHHRETNNLIGLQWDFIDKTPRIVAIFFSSRLEEKDWGEIVQPKEGGGRTTSVSIMSRAGVKKMYEDWICVIDDKKYINFLNNYNNGTLLN